MSSATPAGWVADPRVLWNICLTAQLDHPPEKSAMLERLTSLCASKGWSTPLEDPGYPTVRAALGALATDPRTNPPLSAVVVGDTVVLRAHHAFVDGLGLLAVLSEVVGSDITSTARGRPLSTHRSESNLGRLREVVFAPPARVAPSVSESRPGEAFAEVTLDRSPRVAELVWAATLAVVQWNTDRGHPARRVSAAVGVSRSGGRVLRVREDSALIRLRHLEGRSLEEVRALVRDSSVSPGRPPASSGALTRAGLRLLAPRLGSTLLVSHVGSVAGAGLGTVCFYPVTGGGSGLSLGAATVGGATTVTLRARGRQHSDEGLADLLGVACEALAG